MYRQEIFWSRPATDIRLRGRTHETAAPPVSRPASEPVAASFPDQSGQPITVVATPPPDLRPLLEAIASQLDSLDQRRQQSLLEMQQVALELAVAVASQLAFQTITSDQHGVEELVRQAVLAMGLESRPTVSLHPRDLELLQKRLAQHPGTWDMDHVQLQSDPGIARGGCRVEGSSGKMLVSDIGLRLTEIRRHWMEELDDSQIERRRSAGESGTLRRFPDRRETA